MDDYLSKPFTQQDLGHTIARWITLPRAASMHHNEAPQAQTPQAPVEIPPEVQLPVSAAPPAGQPLNRQALENIRALSHADGDALLERVILALPARRAPVERHARSDCRRGCGSAAQGGAQPQVGQRQRGCRWPGTAVQGNGKLGRAGSTEGAAALLQQMQQAFLAVRESLSAILVKEH